MTKTTPTPEPAGDAAVGLAGFFAKFTVLRGAMRELWLTFLIKILVIAAYGVTNLTLVLWFTSGLGFGDEKALALVSAWSLTMSVFTVLVGSLTDALGLRLTFFWGVGISIAARAVMVLSTAKWLALAGGLFPLAIGEALTGPVLVAAVRHYANTKQRSISFSIIYMMMNVGFLLSHFIFDWVREHFGESGHWSLPALGLKLTTYQVLFLVSLGFQCIIWPLLYLLREGTQATDKGVEITPREHRHVDKNLFTAFRLTVKDTVKDTSRLFAGLLRQNGFYRLLAFLILVSFLKLIYRQMDYVYPKYGIRMLGTGAPIGHVLALNDIFVILLLPIIGALTQRFSAYAMVIVGGAIAAASVFFLALPTAWFVPAANSFFGQWFGHRYLGLSGNINPIYIMSAIFFVMYSFGEAFYSPRVYEYAAAIAPKGQEASYSALSYIPFLLAKMLTGFSGILLVTYCPETGVRRPEIMWLIIGLTACIAPVGLLVLGRVIRLREAGRDD